MEYRYLGRTGLRVSNMCLGTMTFGSTQSTRPGQADEVGAHALLDAFVAAGGNFVDTADVYQMGEAEVIVGKWLKKQPRRDKIILGTKLFASMRPEDPNCMGLSRHHILTNVEESLKRLQTDYIDILFVHTWDHKTDIEETMRALTDLVRNGKVHYLGASNFTGWQLQKASDVSKYLGLERFCCVEQQYNLLVREIELEVMDVCQQEQLSLLPWSPLKGGWLSGKVSRDQGAPEGTRMHNVSAKNIAPIQSGPSFDQYNNDKTWKVLDACKKAADKHGKTVPQVAIRWLLQKDNVPSVIIGAKTLEQLADNLGAVEFRLDEADMANLDAASESPLPYPYNQQVWMNEKRMK